MMKEATNFVLFEYLLEKLQYSRVAGSKNISGSIAASEFAVQIISLDDFFDKKQNYVFQVGVMKPTPKHFYLTDLKMRIRLDRTLFFETRKNTKQSLTYNQPSRRETAK